MSVLRERAAIPFVGERQDERPRRVVERERRGARHRARHVGDAIVDDAVDHEGRMRMAWSGATSRALPPWSIATSTITEPGFICLTVAAEISFGAAAPGTSTAPMTRSALRHSVSIAWRLDATVRTREPNARRCARSDRRCRRHGHVGAHAHRDEGRVAADHPPPITSTCAGGTPGTPPSSMPRPPFDRSRNCAPTCVAIRPATSDIGVSSGNAARPRSPSRRRSR